MAAFTMFSCQDYLDINTSPNNPTGENVTPDLILPGVQANSYRTLTRRMNEYGNVFMNNWGANVNAFTGGYAEEFGITVTNNFYDDVWDGVFRSTVDYTTIINYPDANYENHKAIAKVLKAFYFQYLVDLYGDIPYTQAHMTVNNTNPSYDDDQAIYRDLVVQVEDAIALMHANPNAKAVGAEDIILGGDMAQWEKFANTLKLRLLLRESTKAETDGASATYLTAEFAELTAANAQFVNQDITINPGYSNAEDATQNPWYNLMYELDETSQKTAFRFRRASAYIANKLNVSPLDPRGSRIFAPIGGVVVGVIQGDASVPDGTAPTNISSLGPGLVKNSAQDGYMMLLSESLLLQAEAVHRGYLAGDAQALFDAAIAASFNVLGAGDPSTYTTSVNLVVGKGYGAIGATSAQQLEAIMYQKSIALNGINGAEIFIEYTRTGLIDTVDMPMNSSTPTGFKPRRLMYPVSEISSNSGNVPTQTVNDVYTTGPFWYVP